MKTKAQGLPFRTIVVATMVIAVLVVSLLIFRNYIGKETKIIGEQLDSFGDADKDGVKNFLDKCPCTSFKEGEQNEKFTGCPIGTEPPKEKKTSC